MYFGVQMYGVSKEWKQDPEGFLKKIYEAGYRQIEPCLGFRVDARDYGFWIPEDLEQAMPLLAKYHSYRTGAEIPHFLVCRKEPGTPDKRCSG